MNNIEAKKDSAPELGSSGWLGGRPPCNLGNGKRNPEYTRWYRKTNPDKLRCYNRSEKAKACATRYKASLHDKNKRVAKDECRCIKCGTVFKRYDVILRGYLVLRNTGGKGVVCHDCA